MQTTNANETCPGCGSITHATESDDLGRCVVCSAYCTAVDAGRDPVAAAVMATRKYGWTVEATEIQRRLRAVGGAL